MSALKYSKKIVIKNKVFKETDLLLLANTLQEQFEEDDWVRDVVVRFDDDSKIRCDDLTVFSTEAFKRRQCKSVAIEYASKHYTKYCKIELFNAAILLSESEINVESTNQIWYESMLKRLETIIDEIEPQKRFIKYTYVLSLALSAIESLIFVIALNNINPFTTVASQTLLSVVCMMLLLLINNMLMDLLKKAYPCVEFAFGPMHRNTSFKKKRLIGIFIPFLMDILLFLLGLLI